MGNSSRFQNKPLKIVVTLMRETLEEGLQITQMTNLSIKRLLTK
jgi:hypothetical protein